MKKWTMDYLVEALSAKLEQEQTVMWDPIPTANRVAMTM